MGRMIRKQVYIEPRQDAGLKRRARELGVSEAEVIRRGIDRVIVEGTVGEEGADVARRQAWETFKAFAEERATMQVRQSGRYWTREELYDERLDHVARR